MVDRRSEILDAAGRLFSEAGYHPTSMRDLARAVNLQGGSLYAHITSKEEVLAEIVEDAARQFLCGARAVPADWTPVERVGALARAHLAVVAREIRRATVFFDEWRFLSPEGRARVQAQRDEYEGFFQRAIADGSADGSFRVEDPRLATLFVLSALNWTYQWFDPAGPLPLDAFADHYVSLILHALGGLA
ncbi:MAG TPA: TetR/AcrR family transcriptional regulator [Thermomicrobiaceae bacterium]|nr:TetR/AcrR family transcriptional regulator [Thermomicrobiaceae bacterium]